MTALLVEGDIGNTVDLGGGEIGAAGIATIGGGLPRRRAGAGDVAIEHRHKALGIGRIAGFDDDIEDQFASAGRQVELVPVLNLTPTLDDDVGVRAPISMALAGYWYDVYIGRVSVFFLFIMAQRFFGDASYAIIGPYIAEVWPNRLRASGMASAISARSLDRSDWR